MVKRNVERHTTHSEAVENILMGMAKTDLSNTVLMSGIGFLAFPDYDFRWPQGAAFAVSRIVRKMRDDGLVKWNPRGYYISEKGKRYIEKKRKEKSG